MNKNTPSLYKKTQTRSRSLLGIELRYISERKILPEILDDMIFYETLFCHIRDKGVEVYYNFTDIEQDPAFAVFYIRKKPHKFKILKDKMRTTQLLLARMRKGLYRNLKKTFSLLSILPALNGFFMLCAESPIAGSALSQKAFRIRDHSDKLFCRHLERIEKMIYAKLEAEYRPYADFLSLNEILTQRYPPLRILKARSNGYILYKGNIYTNISREQLGARFNLKFESSITAEPKECVISGMVAYKASVRGTVKVVHNPKQKIEFGPNDIIVAPMTTPEYMHLVLKAKGIITDEGGITCHAAIVARELKKPCIIGTKVATKVLKDGDFVEIDGETGVVRKI